MLPEIQRFQKWLKRKAPHASTPIHYGNDLELFFVWLSKPPGEVRVSDVDSFIEFCQKTGLALTTINRRLAALRSFYHFLTIEAESTFKNPVIPKRHFIRLGQQLPRDIQDPIVEKLFAAISGPRDRTMFLLMLHSGLRTCEVRFLRLQDVDWEGRKVRIEQAKGMKDRIAYLSQATIDALKAYLDVRGVKEALPDFIFVFRHQPLTKSYCGERLRTCGQRCGLHVTPHQLRHSCATLLLNSGAPVLTVQTLLGHKWVDTTLGYARLYDGTVAADYYGAMALIERRLALPEDRISAPPKIGQLIALVDSLHTGTLNATQNEAVRQLRAGIMALSERERAIQDVKVLAPAENQLTGASSKTKSAV
jgi:site-specific recombinase XerD